MIVDVFVILCFIVVAVVLVQGSNRQRWKALKVVVGVYVMAMVYWLIRF